MTGLEARRVQVRAGGRLLVDGVDCDVRPGRLVALVGPNGAGKSTLLRALAAVERPQAGEVRFAREDLLRMSRRRRARLAALVEQDAVTDLSLTVRETVALGRLPHETFWAGDDPDGNAEVEAALTRAGVSGLADRDVTSLSGGERQRVLLAKALAQRTPLLLLDEPTNHLDISAQLSVLGLLRELATQGRAVLAALHDLNLAATFSDHVIVLETGRVVAAGPTAQTLTPELIRNVYGVDATVVRHPENGRAVIAYAPLATEETVKT